MITRELRDALAAAEGVRVRQAREQFEREMQDELQRHGRRAGNIGWRAGEPPG